MAPKNKQNRTIVLNFTEQMYSSFIEDRAIAHEVIKKQFNDYPELFPKGMENGYMLNGKTRLSKKLGIRMRKIKVGKFSIGFDQVLYCLIVEQKHQKFLKLCF